MNDFATMQGAQYCRRMAAAALAAAEAQIADGEDGQGWSIIAEQWAELGRAVEEQERESGPWSPLAEALARIH